MGHKLYSNQFTIEDEYLISAGGYIVVGGESVAERQPWCPKTVRFELGQHHPMRILRLLHCGPRFRYRDFTVQAMTMERLKIQTSG